MSTCNFLPREFHVCALNLLVRLCAIFLFRQSKRHAVLVDHILRAKCSLCLACGSLHVLLFFSHAINEVFSAAANQKPFVNKDLCIRKSVK